MEIPLSKTQLRRLLDLVYIGNWVLNSTRGDARFVDYDQVESILFQQARAQGLAELAQDHMGEVVPSQAFIQGGIHTAIAEYEGAVFFDILAEDLARRDMGDVDITPLNYNDFIARMDDYLDEFEENGTDNITIASDD